MIALVLAAVLGVHHAPARKCEFKCVRTRHTHVSEFRGNGSFYNGNMWDNRSHEESTCYEWKVRCSK
jgi:hypothetical protein